MSTNRAWVLLLLIIPGLSCEKTITFTPKDAEPKLVVDAVIEEGSYPVVRLTNSLSYFGNITTKQLAGSFVKGASITVSNGTVTHTLKEYSVGIGDFALSYYTADSAQSTAFRGVQGETYNMIIKVDGKEYSAATAIPANGRTLDTLEFENVPVIDTDRDTTRVTLYGTFTDPPGFGNYIRYYVDMNTGGGFLPPVNSVYDDQIIDGKSFRLPLDKGYDKNFDIEIDDDFGFFHRGDSITIKFCNIDRSVFDFWRTMEYSYSSIGNPFSSPTKVSSNVNGGALGYFGGYSVAYHSIKIPD